MAEVVVRRCISCRGERQVEPIKERVYIEPFGPEDVSPVVMQGYICAECAVVHWAWEVNANSEG